MWIERDGAGPKLSAAAVVLLAALASPAAAASEPAASSPVSWNRVGCPLTRAVLERTAEGALRRLRRPSCQQVFADFRDTEGRLLQDKLEALGETGASYLTDRMWFVDGSGTRGCQSSETVVVTAPRSPVVFVCARQLREWGFSHPDWVEALLIHEELHSLGLGENPPSSREISEQIARRCGRR